MFKISISEILASMPQMTARTPSSEPVCIERIATFKNADPRSLVYVTSAKFLGSALESSAGVILTSEQIFAQPTLKTDKTILLHPNPDLAIATLIRKYFSRDIRQAVWWEGSVHPMAIVSPQARLGHNVRVAPGALIGPGCEIGDDVYVGANVVVEENVRIGARTILYPNCFIGHHCELGTDCEILPNSVLGSEGFGYAHTSTGEHHRIPHIGRLLVGNRVEVGANTSIDRGKIEDTVIGDGTKFDNQCHVAHNCRIGKNCLITAGFISAGSATVGDNCVFGGRASITGHVTITDNVHLGGLSAVTKSIDQPGPYGGHPLQPLKDYLRTTASLVHLSEMRRQIILLMKKVFPDLKDS